MNRSNWATLSTLLLTASPLLADDSPGQPAKSAVVQAVFAKRDAAVTKALATYQAALNDADKHFIADVEAATRRPAVSSDQATMAELAAAKRAAQLRIRDPKATDPEFPIVAATYGNLDKSVDVFAGVRGRLANGDDLWVDKNITDGKLQVDGDLRLVLRGMGGRSVILTCRHGSRVFLTRQGL